MATPLTEDEAMELFASIKASEYAEVIALWDNEMKIKKVSRSSNRKSLWDDDEEEPVDAKDHSPYFPKEKSQTIGTP